MSLPSIPRPQMIPTSSIVGEEMFGGLKVVRYQSDEEAQQRYNLNQYEFQHDLGKLHRVSGATVSLKGAKGQYRIVATLHLTLRQFREIVRYNPADPPLHDYEAEGMIKAHEQTQQDFKGAKKENLANFKQYNIEAIRGDRIAYLPAVTGWQSSSAFSSTVFVALDESNPMSLYGVLYLPIKPVMQSDGQTQTAALFQAAASELAVSAGALDSFGATLEIELNMTPERAGQSFADRNGRGSKKNKNLVAVMDKSSALAQLRSQAISGTIFEHRLANGRNGGVSETATPNIVDLSTMEQILLAIISRGTRKSEQIKHYHVAHLLPYCRDFFLLLEQNFGHQWIDPTPKHSEPYRRIYIHGWAFALKALAIAYHDCRRDEIYPLSYPIGRIAREEYTTVEAAEKTYLAAISEVEPVVPVLPLAEFRDRLRKIDWVRYRKHWIEITGYKVDKDAKIKTRSIKTGESGEKFTIVDGKVENTAASINNVVKKLLSSSWEELTLTENYPVPSTE